MVRISSALIDAAEHLYYASHRRGNLEEWIAGELGALAPGDAVLDFGGGDGHISRGLRTRLGGHFLVADPSQAILRNVPRAAGMAPVRIASLPQLPIKTGCLAAAVLVDVLHHVLRVEGTLTELTRCLRPGGVLAIVEFEPRRLTTKFFGALVRTSGRHCRFHTPSELADTLRARGLRVSVTRLDGLRYGLAARC